MKNYKEKGFHIIPPLKIMGWMPNFELNVRKSMHVSMIKLFPMNFRRYNFRTLSPLKLPKITKMKIVSYVGIGQEKTENYEVC